MPGAPILATDPSGVVIAASGFWKSDGTSTATGDWDLASHNLTTTGTGIFGIINDTGLTASKAVFTDASKNLTSTGIGTSSQFLKGDGSLDSGTYLTDAPSNGTTYGRNNAAWVAAGGGVSTQCPLPNMQGYTQGSINVEGCINGDNLILTAPTGKNIWVVTMQLSSWNVTGSTTFYAYIKLANGTVNGVFTNSGTSLSANAFTQLNCQMRIVLAAGDQLYLHTNNTNLFVSCAYHQFTRDSGGYGLRQIYTAVDNAQNYLLYTCPANHTASILSVSPPFTSTSSSATICGYNTSSATPTITIWFVKAGSSVGNANKVGTFSLGAGNVNSAFSSITVSGGFAAGDRIYATSTSASAGQYVFFGVWEQ